MIGVIRLMNKGMKKSFKPTNFKVSHPTQNIQDIALLKKEIKSLKMEFDVLKKI